MGCMKKNKNLTDLSIRMRIKKHSLYVCKGNVWMLVF